MTDSASFTDALNERFHGILDWQQLEALWQVVRRNRNGWYIYAIGEPPPTKPRSSAELDRFLGQIGALLRHDLRSDSCGVVYTDSKQAPTLIKIYDPYHMGGGCGGGGRPAPLPAWILTRIPPTELAPDRVLPENRRRWWRALWQQRQLRDTRSKVRET